MAYLSKQNFYAAYRVALLNTYAWADEPAKMERFMSSVKATLDGAPATWNHDGEAVKTAWNAIGGKARPTLKALRALPEWLETV